MARGVSRKKKPGAAKKSRTRKQPAKKQTGAVIKSKRKDRVIIDPSTGEDLVMKQYDRYPEAVRQVTRLLYISGQMKPAEISKKFNIPIHTIRTWQTRDKWSFLKRQVNRLASRDAVKAARKAMGRYITDIDRGLNDNLAVLNTRLDDVDDEHKMKDEYMIINTILRVWKMKIEMFRALTHGVHGKAFYPSPDELRFDNTEPPTAQIFGQNELEKLLNAVPEYMREAAKFVTGISPEDVDEDVLDAVAMQLEKTQEEAKADRKARKVIAAAEMAEKEQELIDLDIDPVEDLLDDEEE